MVCIHDMQLVFSSGGRDKKWDCFREPFLEQYSSMKQRTKTLPESVTMTVFGIFGQLMLIYVDNVVKLH